MGGIRIVATGRARPIRGQTGGTDADIVITTTGTGVMDAGIDCPTPLCTQSTGRKAK